MTEPTPPTALELLARLIPQSGPGIDEGMLQTCLYAHGLDIDAERLERILEYLVAGEMVTCQEGRYRQVGRVRF